MKILFVHNYYQQAGGEDVAFESEAALLKDRGHNIQTAIFKNSSANNLLKKIGTGLSAFYNFNSAVKLKRKIKKFQPDIIHIHNLFFTASTSVLTIAKKLKIPVVLTLHNYRLICCNAMLLRDNKICELCVNDKLPTYGIRYKCYHNSASESAMVTAITGYHKLAGTWNRNVTLYIALTQFAKTKFINSSLQVAEDRIVAQPNFDTDPGNGTDLRENFFVFAGRISAEKGVENLLEAFKSLTSYTLVIAGDGPLKNELQFTYRDYPNIIFKGMMNRNELMALIKRSKALVFPSTCYEMLPFVIIEAFATGTPVLASNLPSIREIVQDGYNGMCFNSADVNDIRNKISIFCGNGEANKPLYANARQTYIDKYHPDRHYNSIVSIYQNAISYHKASL